MKMLAETVRYRKMDTHGDNLTQSTVQVVESKKGQRSAVLVMFSMQDKPK